MRDLEGGHGTVLLRDHFWTAPDGREVTGITGRITSHSAEQMLGFPTSGRDSNWILHIEGEQGTIVLPGCAVLGVHLHQLHEHQEQYLNLDHEPAPALEPSLNGHAES